MREFLRDLGRDAMTARTLLNSARRISFSREPNVTWWDKAPNERVESVVSRLSNPNDEERKQIKRILGELETQSVLDAGCGPCTEYQSYRSNGFMSDVSYVGVDRSQRMLNVSRNRFNGINLVRADIESLPFKRGSFDAVVMKHVLEHQPNGYKETILEALRVARKAVVIDFFHMLLPFGVRINDREGFANNWYARRDFESFLLTLPIAYFEKISCSGTSGQWAEIYTLRR